MLGEVMEEKYDDVSPGSPVISKDKANPLEEHKLFFFGL